MDNGWIKIHRKLIDWEWYQDSNTSRLFFHLLILANHDKGSWRGNILEQGKLITGRKSLAKSLGLTEMQIRRALKNLKTTNDIGVRTTNQFSIITIINWAKYQGRPEKTTSETTSKRPNEQPQTRSKEVKNNTSEPSSQVNNLIELFKEVNPTYTDFYKNTTERRALEGLIKQITYDKLRATIECLPKLIFLPYAPKITKPSELKRDLGKLIAFSNQQRSALAVKSKGFV